MLTYPSDSLPQIVCPMDDAIPPNPFCSASPHSEPSPPVLSLSSITPSCANDGLSSGHRRSGRIQGNKAQSPQKQNNTDSQTAQQPSKQSPSPPKRQGESRTMVSQSKRTRVERTGEKQSKDGLDIDFTAEHQNTQTDQRSPWKKQNASPEEHVAELPTENTAENLDAARSDMDTCEDFAQQSVKNASQTGWVIGPLIQSFKSKMASFTEIVMSPAKLFKTNHPLPSMDHPDSEFELEADGANDAEQSEARNMSDPEGQSQDRNEDTQFTEPRLKDTWTASPRFSKKLDFDMDLSTPSSEKSEEVAMNQERSTSDFVPLPPNPLPHYDVSGCGVHVTRSPVLLRSSVNVSASNESKLRIPSAVNAQLKPLPRKRAGNRSELKRVNSKDRKEELNPEVSEISHQTSGQSDSVESVDTDKAHFMSSSVCYTQPDAVCDAGIIVSCNLVQQSLQNNPNDDANKRTLKPTLGTQEPECQPNPETGSDAGLGRTKRAQKVSSITQDSVKRKRLKADACVNDMKNPALNKASDNGIQKGRKPKKKEAVLINTNVDGEEMLKPVRKRQVASSKTNRKGKCEQEMLPTINEVVLQMQTESAPDAMLICSLDKTSGLSDNNHKGRSSSLAKATCSSKRQKTRKAPVSIDNSMDLETTVAITSSKQTVEEPFAQVLVHPDIKESQTTENCSNLNKKPLKRKSPKHATSTDCTLGSTSSLLSESVELSSTHFNTSQYVQKEDNLSCGMGEPSKRPKRGLRGQLSLTSQTSVTEQCISSPQFIIKESQSEEVRGKMPTDPLYFEMTVLENNSEPVSSSSRLHVDSNVQLAGSHFNEGKEESTASMSDKVLHTNFEGETNGSNFVSRRRSSAKRVKVRPRIADNQRRKCRVLHSRTRKCEEETKSICMEDADVTTPATQLSEKSSSRHLLRSYSCPEIPSLRPHDTPWNSPPPSSHHHSRTHASHQQHPSHTPVVSHTHKFVRRVRRHTVCSLEVEREIAPLCLRKEVYPSRRSTSYDNVAQHLSPTLALSPSTSLSFLASCFLSSPLAFLSKKVDSRGATDHPSTSSHMSTPTPGSFTWHPSGFIPRTDSSGAILDSSSSGIPSVIPECEIGKRQQSEEEDDGEDTSCSSQEFEDIGLREEKALSDSEIKVVQKHEERGKVSSIRIRKTLPKPQNNLTPMGLPKAVRVKKKKFSLEEIYTNKNFSNPPESRLETIFEVPLSRKNGSESWFSQRRVKRFLEFLDVGEARKPKKPLVGVGKAAVSSSRTRRGFSKHEPSLGVQDVDSLLCAKLDQLNLWLIHDQKDG